MGLGVQASDLTGLQNNPRSRSESNDHWDPGGDIQMDLQIR